MKIDNRTYWLVGAGLLGVALFSTCGSIPRKAKPINHFELDRYLGTWHEIARFDHRFERNLNNVTARYSLNDDGTVRVVNRGFDTVKNAWKSATGKAKFRKDKQTAALKVSFFGPFYSGYNVIAIDADYQYALVAGESLKYLWILSRTTTIPPDVKKDYLERAKEIGYDTSKLIWVAHNKD
ncbi:lipocalin family protein [Parapedobacter sp. GCM10030251]|uniref:lipocalin family protein n=1 Tax=Parapedobacter sp. GCM10030251 TaxID=3273419 RepID=UPI00360E479B